MRLTRTPPHLAHQVVTPSTSQQREVSHLLPLLLKKATVRAE